MIDTGLLSELNHFKEVDYEKVERQRPQNNQLPANAFFSRIVGFI